jgi:phospholipid/cholesterol/gamma-HCH transport system substrate-binding protein
MQRNSLFEILLCAAVVVLAAGFLAFVRIQTGIGTLTSYDIRVELKKADGLASGADVRVFGVKVGSVQSLSLDSTHYLADLTLSIRSDLKIPSDSAFHITPGTMTSAYLAIEPGKSTTAIAPGSAVTVR